MKCCTSKYMLLGILLFFSFSNVVKAQSVVAAGYTFTASQKNYSYLSGGTTVSAVQVDDAYTTIPIGFTFKFCGVDYTDVTVCSNGWLRFGTGAGTSSANWNYNATQGSGIEPAVYVLYEDVSGVGGTSTYTVTGTAPNRIFKWECRDWLWDYAASTPSVSFQVWLYETSGVVECMYKQESGSVSVGSSGGATIGIGTSFSDFQTLDGAGTNPTSSSTTYTYNITSRPGTGQSYAWDPGPACTAPTSLAVNLVNSTYVEFSWSGVSGSQGYEYIVDQNAANPATTATPQFTSLTSANESSLTPSTQYYIHLRNKCGNYNYSSWVTLPFMTLPPCSIPAGFTITYVDTNSANFIWQALGTAVEYEYVVNQDKNTPTGSTTGINSTTNNSGGATGLNEGETYYVHLRVKCTGNDSSGWLLDSFYTPVPCRTPLVQFSDINTSRAVAYWDVVNTATGYEYAVNTSATPPGIGTEIHSNSKLLPFLDPKQVYYFHIKSMCNDRGVLSTSDWRSFPFETWGLSVNAIAGDEQVYIYPNPVRDRFTLYTNLGVNEKATGTIVNMSGSVVKQISITQKEAVFNIQDLPNGMYFIKVNGEDFSQVVRLVKE